MLKGQGLDVAGMLVEGDPVDQILRESRRLAASLIVVGSHGRRGLLDLLMGSVSTGVLRRAPCPVLVVPTRTA